MKETVRMVELDRETDNGGDILADTLAVDSTKMPPSSFDQIWPNAISIVEIRCNRSEQRWHLSTKFHEHR